MTKVYKIIFAGPVGAGKTKAISVLSDIEVVSTEAKASDDVKQLKETTTVAMDYGVMKLDSGERVRLYGTPGQKRFDFMWEILSENALGVVLLISAEQENPIEDARNYLQDFRSLIDTSAIVLGVTHAENADWQLFESLNEMMIEEGLPAYVMPVDARDKEQMQDVVRNLLYLII